MRLRVWLAAVSNVYHALAFMLNSAKYLVLSCSAQFCYFLWMRHLPFHPLSFHVVTAANRQGADHTRHGGGR